MRLVLPLLPFEIVIQRRTTRLGKFRVRDLMLLVALVAVVIHLWGNSERAARYAHESGEHARRSEEVRWLALSSRKIIDDNLRLVKVKEAKVREAASSGDWVEVARLNRGITESNGVIGRTLGAINHLNKKAFHHWALYEKYNWAASRAWLPLLPDPEEP